MGYQLCRGCMCRWFNRWTWRLIEKSIDVRMVLKFREPQCLENFAAGDTDHLCNHQGLRPLLQFQPNFEPSRSSDLTLPEQGYSILFRKRTFENGLLFHINGR